MGFGLFKKIKDAAKKFLPKLSGIMKKIAPVVKTVTQEARKALAEGAPKYISNEKVKNYLNTADEIFDVTNSGVDAINNAVNKNDYDDVKNWVNYEIKPRLKRYH